MERKIDDDSLFLSTYIASLITFVLSPLASLENDVFSDLDVFHPHPAADSFFSSRSKTTPSCPPQTSDPPATMFLKKRVKSLER